MRVIAAACPLLDVAVLYVLVAEWKAGWAHGLVGAVAMLGGLVLLIALTVTVEILWRAYENIVQAAVSGTAPHDADGGSRQ
jgi:hypothetical protein